MNINDLFHDGMTRAEVENAFEVMRRIKLRFERIAGRIRPIKFLEADILRYDLSTYDGTQQLELHLMNEWSCREIDMFSSFLHGGRFIPDSRGWVRDSAGLSTATHQEDSNLSRIWRHLTFLSFAYIGAAAVLDLRNACVKPGMMFTDEGDGPSPWDMTICELIKIIPEEKRKRLDIIDHIDSAKQEVIGKMMLLTPSQAEYQVSTEQLSGILSRLNASIGKRMIEKWEQYLRSNGSKGNRPPVGYTLQTRLELSGAVAWARTYAAGRNGKLRTKVSYEALTGGRN